MKKNQLKSTARVFILLVAALLFVCNALTVSTWTQQTDPAAAGQLGATYAPGVIDSRLRIAGLDRQGALARAGAKAGDLIVFAHAGSRQRDAFSLDELVDLTLYAQDQKRHLQLRPLAAPTGDGSRTPLTATMRLLNGFIAILLAVVIVMRKGEDGAMLAFAASLLANAPTSFSSFLPAGALQDFAIIVVRPLDYVSGYLFFLLFALKFPTENAYFERRHVAPAFCALGAVFLLSTVLRMFAENGLMHVPPALYEPGRMLSIICSICTALLSLAALSYSWHTSRGNVRNRVGWILLSIGTTYIVWIGYNVNALLDVRLAARWDFYAETLVNFLAYIGFAYALLRHQIFDFGFAVNRALVYTIISTALLVTFAVTEFAVDKLLHFEGRQKNIIFDAIVALGIILSFHRIQRWITHKVEHTFFHSWHEAAEKLRQVIEQAAHITSAEILRRRFASALEVFASSNGVAIYGAAPDGAFVLQYATLAAAPVHIDANHALAVALRHQALTINLDELATGLPGALALPMTLRGVVTGLILMAGKDPQQALRPDQLALIKSSVNNLAAQLEGVRIQELEQFAATLHGREAELEHKLAAAEREARDLRTGNLDLRDANAALRVLVRIG